MGPVVWRIQLDDVDIASVRYRCLVPIRHLRARGVDSVLSWGDFEPPPHRRPRAIVFVKAFRPADAALAERAAAAGIPVVLDICDNLFSADYTPGAQGSDPATFARMVGAAAAIVTTGTALRDALRGRLGPDAPLHVVADPLETPGDVRFAERLLWRERVRNGRAAGPRALALTAAIAARRELAGHRPARRRPATADGLPQVVWYGNVGYERPRFGLVNLVDCAAQLVAAARRARFRLLVVSGDETAYARLIAPLPLDTAYAPWDRRGIFAHLARSALALVPNSRDDFSICKSANRAVAALHAGVPVVATRTPALEPLAGCVGFDDFEGEVVSYLTDRERTRADLARAREVIAREFAGPVIAARWAAILDAIAPA